MNILRLYIILFLIISCCESMKAQRGFRYCKGINIEDYDYMGQSAFAWLTSGDTSVHKAVIYANADYKIFVCGPRKLGNIYFRVYESKRVKKSFIDNLGKKRSQIGYKDTLLFDSQNSGEKFWKIDKNPYTRRLAIEVFIEKNSKRVEDAVDILIGKRLGGSKRFRRPRGHQW